MYEIQGHQVHTEERGGWVGVHMGIHETGAMGDWNGYNITKEMQDKHGKREDCGLEN